MTAGAAAASLHDLNQESFMKIAVKNLSGLAALLLFAAATLATAYAHDRKTIDLGTVTITTVDADSDAAQKALAFDPTRLTDGIELSDDPLPALRSEFTGCQGSVASVRRRPKAPVALAVQYFIKGIVW